MKFRTFALLSVGAMAVAGVLLLTQPSGVDNKIIFYENPAPDSGIKAEITLRNVTRETIEYYLSGPNLPKSPVLRKLKVGAIDRYSTDMPLDVTFNNHKQAATQVVYPGLPYSFRTNENDLIRIYPGSHGREDAEDLAPWVPSPQPVVERMLETAQVTGADVVYDIGSGDGRIVITAAKKFGARGVGIDIDENFIAQSNEAARKEGVTGLTRFIAMDATKAHYSEATVLTMYLLPESLDLFKPLFEKELKPGTRIVTHNYSIRGWEDKLVRTEHIDDENGKIHSIHLYIVK